MGILTKPIVVNAPSRIYVAGTTQYQTQLGRTSLRPTWRTDDVTGDPVTDCKVRIVAEPKNAHDSRAVAVKFGTMIIGYVPTEWLDWAHQTIDQANGARVFIDALVVHYDEGDGNLGVILP